MLMHRADFSLYIRVALESHRKELFSALSATILYPLVSLVLPGLAAFSAWFVYSAQKPILHGMVSRNHPETALVLLLLAVFTGTLIDDMGMRIESMWLDRERERRTGGRYREEWWEYLRKPFVTEPSGRRHLRRLVARLKFELGVPIGFVIGLPAIWIGFYWAPVITLLGLCVSSYLLFEAAATHEALGQLRHELLKSDGLTSLVPRKPVQSA